MTDVAHDETWVKVSTPCHTARQEVLDRRRYMNAPSRRPAHGPLVTRHFEFTRDQGRSIASAYEALIPVISRHVGGPRGGGAGPREALPRPGHPRSSAGGG